MLEQVYELFSKEEDSFSENISLLDEYIASIQGRDLALYGAGGIGYATCVILKNKGCNVCCFIDDDKAKQGTTIHGIKVVALQSIGCETEYEILICVPNFMDMLNKLTSLGYKAARHFPVMMAEKGYYNHSLIRNNWDKVSQTYSLLADSMSESVFCNILMHRITMDFSYLNGITSPKQYFPNELFTLGTQECFVDGGAYSGETIADFINATDNNYQCIYAFEPDRQNFKQLRANTRYIKNKRLHLFNAGLYSGTKEIGFNSLGNSGSFISETGKDRISLIKLDDMAEELKPTYIKLDIEGVEGEALYGMKNIIAACHPKLAISIYHKASDLWELPLMIHTLDPSCNIHIRHYNKDLNETVCYAT
jgi:FkbM family methyltransferase